MESEALMDYSIGAMVQSVRKSHTQDRIRGVKGSKGFKDHLLPQNNGIQDTQMERVYHWLSWNEFIMNIGRVY